MSGNKQLLDRHDSRLCMSVPNSLLPMVLPFRSRDSEVPSKVTASQLRHCSHYCMAAHLPVILSRLSYRVRRTPLTSARNRVGPESSASDAIRVYREVRVLEEVRPARLKLILHFGCRDRHNLFPSPIPISLLTQNYTPPFNVHYPLSNASSQINTLENFFSITTLIKTALQPSLIACNRRQPSLFTIDCSAVSNLSLTHPTLNPFEDGLNLIQLNYSGRALSCPPTTLAAINTFVRSAGTGVPSDEPLQQTRPP